VTLFAAFPPILANLLDHATTSGTDLSSLRVVLGLDTRKPSPASRQPAQMRSIGPHTVSQKSPEAVL
jgi:hypothetical protein